MEGRGGGGEARLRKRMMRSWRRTVAVSHAQWWAEMWDLTEWMVVLSFDFLEEW